MKEKELINIIKDIVGSEYIGDDCAYLKDIGIVVSQDSLVENVHFSLRYTSAYQLGWKSVMVNISDICASGAEPKYLTIALSIPEYVDENFVSEFYRGAKDASKDVKIVGGDITGSDKLFISVSAIGSTKARRISSRSNAKIGYKVIVSGEHGNSAMGLKILNSEIKNPQEKEFFIKKHLMPEARIEFSKQIAQNISADYAMMDSSDGLADVLCQIAKASSVKIKIDSSLIPHNKNVDMDTVLYGGEDYELVAVVPEDILSKISDYTVIGEAVSGNPAVEIDSEVINNIDNKIYNHFED